MHRFLNHSSCLSLPPDVNNMPGPVIPGASLQIYFTEFPVLAVIQDAGERESRH